MTAEAAGATGARPRRVLLLGASGRLGAAIAQALPARGPIDLVAPTRGELAFEPAAPGRGSTAALDHAVGRWLSRWQPDLMINCIAMSDVDRCEREPEAAGWLNAALPGALGRGAQPDIRLIHFSTDFVFGEAPDGPFDTPFDAPRDASPRDSPTGAARRPYRESDPARPLSVYGSSKLAGERAVAESGCRHWTFRVSWLYGSPSGNLAARLLDPASAGQTIRLASNRIGVPNPVRLLANEIAACATSRGEQHAASEPPSGVYHLACHGFTSWYEFGVEFVRQAIAAGRIAAERRPRLEAFDEATLRRPAPRPNWSPLDSALYERTFDRTMPHWRDAIAAAQVAMTRS